MPAERPAPGRRAAPAWAWAGISVLLLAPCWWQSRIQAGDLSSHIYNAWLAQLIARGEAPGLRLVPQHTNVLFDLMLSGLLDRVGAAAAQGIAVSAAVLALFWGAFAFVAAVSGHRPWGLTPLMAMLAYGWGFHMGLFNFYLSVGLCLWAMALAWRSTPARLAGAAVLFAVAVFAHALPVAWAVGILAYRLAALRLKPRYRLVLLAAGFGALGLLRLFLAWRYATSWSPSQAQNMLGFDQVWVFGGRYVLMSAGLMAVVGALLLRLFHDRGAARTVSGIPFQMVALTADAVFLLPTGIQLPGSAHPLNLIAERMSLPVGLALCALVGAAKAPRAVTAGAAGLCTVFFCWLYQDHAAVNRFEDRMEAALAQLPPGRRVVSTVSEQVYRVTPLVHVVDRACLGRCFSYANYEPPSGAFRVRVTGVNPFVIASHVDSYEMQNGRYRFKAAELPVYAVEECGARAPRLCVREVKAEQYAGLCSWSR